MLESLQDGARAERLRLLGSASYLRAVRRLKPAPPSSSRGAGAGGGFPGRRRGQLMPGFVSKRDESVPLFDNPVLESLSRALPATPLFYVPVLVYFGYVGVVEQGWLVAG